MSPVYVAAGGRVAAVAGVSDPIRAEAASTLDALRRAAAVGAFIWAVRSGQMDDLDTPSLRVLIDDEEAATPQGQAPPSPRERRDP